MNDKKNPMSRWLLLVAAAGLAVGLGLIYVIGPPDGNGEDAAQAFAQQCPVSKVAKTKVEPAISGDVAALVISDPKPPLTDLAFRLPDGKPTSLKDFTGKTILLNLWATWCAPCREEMPALDALQALMGDESFEVVAVNVDHGEDDTKPRAFWSETGLQALAYYRDPTIKLFNDLKKRGLAVGLPVTLLIGEDGCLIAHMNGPAHWSGTDAINVIKATGS